MKAHLRPATGACVAALLGLAACAAGNAAPPVPPPFDAERAWADLEALVALGPRPAGSPAIEASRQLIEERLRGAGLDPQREPFTAETPLGSIEMANVYADLPGAAKADGSPANLVILLSHFDTKRFDDFVFVGANDGGSSTAVLLELARSLATADPRPLSYRFLFVDGEEATREHWAGRDNTYGSRHHAEALEKANETVF